MTNKERGLTYKPKEMTPDIFKPSTQLLIKLGSLIIHYQELNSKGGHAFDKIALDSLEADPDVKEWLKQMDELALLPKKRNQ